MKKHKYESQKERIFKNDIKSIVFDISLILNVFLVIIICCVIWFKNNEIKNIITHYEVKHGILQLVINVYRQDFEEKIIKNRLIVDK